MFLSSSSVNLAFKLHSFAIFSAIASGFALKLSFIVIVQMLNFPSLTLLIPTHCAHIEASDLFQTAPIAADKSHMSFFCSLVDRSLFELSRTNVLNFSLSVQFWIFKSFCIYASILSGPSSFIFFTNASGIHER
jgi:hypothetical protein